MASMTTASSAHAADDGGSGAAPKGSGGIDAAPVDAKGTSTTAHLTPSGSQPRASTDSSSGAGVGATASSSSPSVSEGRFGRVVVRVKRKRHEIDEAPARILLPQKRVRAEDELASSLQALGVNKDSASATGAQAATHDGSNGGISSSSSSSAMKTDRGRKRAFMCELVPDADVRHAHQGYGSGSAAHQANNSRQHQVKRLKYVDLELSEKGLRPCVGRQRRHDDELDFYLWHAASSGDLGLVNTVIEQPSRDINFQRPADGLSALMIACMYADTENVAKYLALGADPSLVDSQGRNAAAHLDESDPANRLPDLKEELFRMLGETEYVYDTYVVRQEVEWDCLDESTNQDGDREMSNSSTPRTDVWRDSGVLNPWGEAVPVADQALDMLDLFGPSGGDQAIFDKLHGDGDDAGPNLTFSPAASEAAESELDDSDNELYRFNDYPEDEAEDEGLVADADDDDDDNDDDDNTFAGAGSDADAASSGSDLDVDSDSG
ncbi:Ankyrin repeat and EF-hand domain-containing protein 1 [Hondaea fermentalgiana]|uniref:Ankyrin repeat and EF-hand domain-containing protein 1 n=1 Tax=Hondaea fermentalgiana TaxID=2315210 RepID=A0A2R5G8R7_9STRA|nr:Ankyrin repeat and EF-hand domain-containing protein 1 [Hondaea fermentalgiana]|eukprot:GBG26178.1 Ankyrin repeat and EF-hand domain-containing protein 1 [Hondaea fermentalgiana]